jgi:hypothetical protein
MNQLFGIGTRVKFLTTPDKGVIVDKLGAGMVMVLLDEVDMEIPAFEEDLVREEFFMQHPHNQQIAQPKPKPIASNNILQNSSAQKPIEETPKPILTNSGVILAFLPFLKSSGEIEKLDIILLNDTTLPIVYEIDYVPSGAVAWAKDGKLNAINFEKLGEIPFDAINENPEFDVSIAPVYTEGVGENIVKTLKIKVKQFLKNHTVLQSLKKEAYAFTLVEQFGADTTSEKNIADYTKELLKNKPKKKQADSHTIPYNPVADVNEYALFVREIDLHIELLHENPSSLTNNDIVAIQLRAFDTYIQKAIRLGVPRVYIIHGVGKGTLKEMIHAKLRRNTDIKRYKNEYNEKYGWGATEVTIMMW